MAVNSVIPPFPSFFDTDGVPLEAGYIFVGQPGLEARSAPKAAFFDLALTISTGPYVRTLAGMPANNGSAAMIYVDGDFSTTVLDKAGVVVYSSLNRTFAFGIEGTTSQPIQAPDGNFGETGFGFIDEPNTGFVRQSAGVMQSVVLGDLIWQQTVGGVEFFLPPSGVGFVSGVAAALDDDLKQISAITAVEGDMLYRNATTWARLPKGTAGQVLRQNDALTSPAWSAQITDRTPQATTAGTAFDFTVIPAWVKRIIVTCAEISVTGSDSFLVQLGTASGFVVVGYSSGGGSYTGGATSVTTASDGFIIRSGGAGEGFSGHMVLTKIGTTWVASYCGAGISPSIGTGGGSVIIAGSITQLRLTRSGTDTFDGGSVSISYE